MPGSAVQKALQELAFSVEHFRKKPQKTVGKPLRDLKVSYLSYRLEHKNLCDMSAMKLKHARLSRSMVEDASCYLPWLALTVPDSAMCAVATLAPLLCSSAGSCSGGEVCILSVFTSQPHCLCLTTRCLWANLP